jgi:hypothetical protein
VAKKDLNQSVESLGMFLPWSSSYTKDGSAVVFLGLQNFTMLQKIYGKINDFLNFFPKLGKKI